MYRDKVIITHGGKPHMDDTLGVAMLISYATQTSGYARYMVMRVEHKHVDAYRDIANSIWVDVGGKHDDSGRFFDHHHDDSLRCSMSLVREWVERDCMGMSRSVDTESSLEAYLDYLDRHGPVAANKLGIISDADSDRVYEISKHVTGLIDHMWTEGAYAYGNKYSWTPHHSIAKVLNSNGWGITIHTLESVLDVLYADFPKEMQLVDEKLELDAKLNTEDLNNVKVLNDKIAKLPMYYIDPEVDNSTYIELQALGAGYMLRKSSRDPNVTNLVANTDKDCTVHDLKHLVPEESIGFIHANGFFMVINLPMTEELIARFK